MDFTKILSISGKPGLYRMLAQTKTGMVVEGIADGKRFTAFAHQRISSLEEISVFTTGEDLPLKEVMKKLYDHYEGKAIDIPAGQEEMRALFASVIEDFDPERVYNSDIRKMLGWYNLLAEHNILDFTEENASEAEEGQPSDAPADPEEEATGEQGK